MAADLTRSLVHILEEVFLSGAVGGDPAAITLSGSPLTQRANVVSAAATLTAAQSGSVCVFSVAGATLYTLPAPVAGMYFDFITAVTATGAHKVITNSASVFLGGSLVNIDDDTSNAVAAWDGDAATHVAVNQNGTTTGGLVGSAFRVTAVTATLWVVSGITRANGIVATPFATS